MRQCIDFLQKNVLYLCREATGPLPTDKPRMGVFVYLVSEVHLSLSITAMNPALRVSNGQRSCYWLILDDSRLDCRRFTRVR